MENGRVQIVTFCGFTENVSVEKTPKGINADRRKAGSGKTVLW